MCWRVKGADRRNDAGEDTCKKAGLYLLWVRKQGREQVVDRRREGVD